MILQAILFYIFAASAVAAGAMVVAARNPVHSVLFLILAFFNTAGLFVLIGAEFLAMILVIVYVGAVAVLFLFVVMMLDIDFAEMRSGFVRYLPIGALVGLVLLAELVLVSVSWVVTASGTVAAAALPAGGVTLSNTRALGDILYTRYVFAFQGAGLILLVAMIGAIVLTLRHRADVRRQSISAQLARTRAQSVEVVKVPVGAGGVMAIGLAHYLTVAAILFTLGIFGIFLNRKNVIIILMSIELMLLAVNINFVAFSVFLQRPDRSGLRDVRADRRRGRGGDRAGHPRRLFPQPRHDPGRRHQHDEGLSAVAARRRLPAADRLDHRRVFRPGDRRPRRADRHLRRIVAVGGARRSWSSATSSPRRRSQIIPLLSVDRRRRGRRLLVDPARYPERGDDPRRHRRVVDGPCLFDRLHGARTSRSRASWPI